MGKGEIRFPGPPSELLERPDILRSVFLEGGGSVTEGQQARRQLARTTERGPARGGAEGDGEAGSQSLLEVRGLSKRFGGIQAVYDVSFDLEPGQILGIIGPNGTGKTTGFARISVFLRN